MANEFKVRYGLQINETQLVTGITNSSTLLNDSSNLATAGAVKGYTDSADSSLSTSISTTMSGEVATRSSADASLTTQISTEISTRTSNVTSLATATSSEISTRTGADTSLQTAISTTMSGEVATRSSADSSLTTAVSARIVADASLQTAISTTMSTEVSSRTSVDTSLSNSINSKLSLTGGTMTGTIIGTQLNLSGTIYVSGLTNDSTQPDVVYYNSTSKVLSYGTKPSGSGGVSYQSTGSTTFTFVGGTGTTIDTYANTKDFAVYFYTVYSGTTEKRAGVITINNNTSSAYLNESTTVDIGLTSSITFTVDINGGNVRLNAISAVGGTWTCKFIKNIM